MARDREVANGGDEMQGQELFETAFDHFVAALRVLSHDAETQCDEMGSYNTPGEIQLDVVRGGLGILRISAEWLDWVKAEKLLDLVAGVRRLPSEALYVPHLSMTSREGCLVAMGHPAWVPLRSDAALLLALLAPEIERNERYFQPKMTREHTDLPSLHDGMLCGIIVRDGEARLLAKDLNGTAFTLVLSGVRRLAANAFAEGNIIFGCYRYDGPDVPDDLLAALNHGSTDEKGLARLRAFLGDGGYHVFTVDPSYGASVVALVQTVTAVDGFVIGKLPE